MVKKFLRTFLIAGLIGGVTGGECAELIETISERTAALQTTRVEAWTRLAHGIISAEETKDLPAVMAMSNDAPYLHKGCCTHLPFPLPCDLMAPVRCLGAPIICALQSVICAFNCLTCHCSNTTEAFCGADVRCLWPMTVRYTHDVDSARLTTTERMVQEGYVRWILTNATPINEWVLSPSAGAAEGWTVSIRKDSLPRLSDEGYPWIEYANTPESAAIARNWALTLLAHLRGPDGHNPPYGTYQYVNEDAFWRTFRGHNPAIPRWFKQSTSPASRIPPITQSRRVVSPTMQAMD